MTLPKPPAVVAFAVWTSFVWGQRIVNIARDSEATGLDLARAVAFVAVGLAVAWVALAQPATDVARRVVDVAAAVTVLLWAVQMIAIPMRDHTTAFVVVHLALGVISITLAVLASRSVRRTRVDTTGRSLPGSDVADPATTIA